jgi:hypothetical protein
MALKENGMTSKQYRYFFFTPLILVLCVGLANLSLSPLSVAAAPPLQEPQQVDITTVADRINRWHLSAFRDYHFNKWISLGDVTRFTERIADGDVQVYIDPVQLKKRGANALYEDCVGVGCSTYMNDIILADTPDKVPAQTVWHEAMHAIFDAHDSELLVDNDEMYTWYMENVINIPLEQVLTRYEQELAKGEACDQERLDQLWSMFERRMEEAKDTGYGTIASDAQLQQLRQLTGFHVDVAAIRQGYVDAGMDHCPAAVPTPPAATLSDLDLIFCIDVTGSMEDDIASVKAAAANIVNTIAAKNKNYRVAIIAYRDWDDTMGYAMFEDYGFSTNKEAIVANINSLSVGGGDDEPEAVFEALMRAIDSQAVGGWREGVNKQVILMGDAPPHNPSRQGFTPAIVAKAAEDADPVIIQAVAVGNDGIYNPEAVAAFRELAELTKGSFFEAADASKVPEILQETIKDIESPGPSPLFSNANVLLIGGLCLLLFIVLVVVALAIILMGKRSKRARQAVQPVPAPVPARSPQPPPQAPGPYAPPPYAPQQPPVHWQAGPAGGQPAHPPMQAETMIASSMSIAELVIEGGPEAGRRFLLQPNTRLGRAPDNEIVLQDAQVSRYHATIVLAGEAYLITDLGSANGTRVNQSRIERPSALRHGDVIAIGSQRLRFQAR